MKEDNNAKLLEDQKNKQHRAIRDKIKKRRDKIKVKRDFKKEKKLKHQQKVLEHSGQAPTLNKVNTLDKAARREIKLQNKITSFLKHYKDDLNDFYDLFDQLDKFEKIDISEMENQKIKKILSKIFKYLKKEIKYDEETKEYSKIINQNQTITLKQKIQKITFKMIEKMNNKQESENEDKEQEEQVSKNQKHRKKRFQQNEEEQIKIDQSRFDFLKKDVLEKKLEEDRKRQQMIIEKPEKPKIKGPTMITEEEKQKFLQQSLQESKRDEDLQGDFLNQILDKSQNYNKLNKMNKNITPVEQTEQELQKQKEIREFMKDYDSKFRGKSLTELHKEKLKEQKKSNGTLNQREEFDRVRDMQFSRHDSKQIFKILNQGQGSLKNRFQNSSFTNSFI